VLLGDGGAVGRQGPMGGPYIIEEVRHVLTAPLVGSSRERVVMKTSKA
jgi:hypothetical protein